MECTMTRIATLLGFIGSGLLLAGVCGCSPASGQEGVADAVWGRAGIVAGRFNKPRAIAIDQQDRLYIVDMTARIQVFDRDGEFLRSWKTPERRNGRPTGLTIGNDGTVLVADTHYYRVLVYDADGELRETDTIGGAAGHAPGEFGFVTDVVQDSAGNFYVAEYGEYDRIQKFGPDGTFLLQWGAHGSEPGQFVRPQNLAIDTDDRIWVADACNHRIQVFDNEGQLLKIVGREGTELGEFYYPYDLAFDADGSLYVCEYGNSRIQKLTADGQAVATWGRSGRAEGELNCPWALACDSLGAIHVLDSNNHRVQRISL